MRYAKRTTVSTARSREEIERILRRYAIGPFRYSNDPNRGIAIIEFAANGRHIRFVLPLPRQDDFSQTSTGKERAVHLVQRDWEQACRQRWRALALAIKSKLETVECEISTFEQEFLAYIVDPTTGQTVGSVIGPQLVEAYEGTSEPLRLSYEESRA